MVRTRFGPSLQAPLSLGGLRIALYNYALASARGGTFVLRVEDIDRRRAVPELERALRDDLSWIGLGEGGAGAPVSWERQSDRLEHYGRHAAVLLEQGNAYRCFCTTDRLAALRARAGRRGYDRHCAAQPPRTASARAAAGEPHVVRLRAPDDGGAVEVDDAVFGRVRVPATAIDDQVMLKSDGFPTMHLASVVDDHLMGITDVVRASVWLSSTAKHVLVSRWLGWEPPRFAHVAPIGRSRYAPTVGQLRDEGLPAAAVVDFAASLGWGDGDARLTLASLCAGFDVGRLRRTCGPARRDVLERIARWHLRRAAPEDTARASLPFLRARGLDPRSPEDVATAVRVVGPRLTSYASLARDFAYLFRDPPLDARARAAVRGARAPLAELRRELAAQPALTAEAVAAVLRAADDRGARERVLRWAVAGTGDGPPAMALLPLIGRDAVLRRLDAALAATGERAAVP